MIEANGQTGQVSFDGQHVAITRTGFMTRASADKAETRLLVSQITAVQWKPAGLMLNGCIQFTVRDGNERRSAPGGQASSGGHGENSVAFTRRQMPGFERLRAAIDEAICRQHAPKGGNGYGPVDDELTKLASLRDNGVITASDFETVKAKLLGTR